MNLQGNVRKPLVEFGLRERPRLLAGLKWGLGGSEDFGVIIRGLGFGGLWEDFKSNFQAPR